MNRKLFIVAQVLLFALLGSAIGANARPADSVTNGATGVALADVTTGSGATQNTQPPPAQDFQDVPPNNIFFNNIRNIYYAGIVSGYPCGGPNEPCGPNLLPYY